MKQVMFILMLTMLSICYAQPIRSIIAAKHIKVIEKEELDPNQYVMDGLIAWYDGEWNVGIGEHDSSTIVWKDLSENGNDLQIYRQLGYNCFWEQDCLRTVSTRKNQIYAVAAKGLQYDSCEWVVEQIEYEGLVSLSGMGDYKFFGKTSGYVQFFNPYEETTIYGTIPDKGSFQCIYLGGDSVMAFANGEQLVRVSGRNNWQYSFIQQNFGIGGGSKYAAFQMCGRIFCVRLYNRKLSTRELAHNLAIDKVRFNLP